MRRAAAALLLVSACAAPPTAVTPTAPVDTSPAPVDVGDLAGFDVADVSVGGRRLKVAVADEPGLRARGFVGVEDLGDLDGILFTWGGEEVDASFHMRGVLLPLDLAVFDGDGRLLGVVRMEPCAADPCTYDPPGPFVSALETPAGRLALRPGDRLVAS